MTVTVDGHQRLETGVTPLAYALTLCLDPSRDSVDGEIRIRVQVDAPRLAVRLHAQALQITHAEALSVGQPPQALTARMGPNGALTLDAVRPLAAGEHTLSLRWRQPLTAVPEGLYAAEADGQRYLFSQLEPLAARRVFPCFDEPGFKAPVELTVRAPRGQTVLANSPLAERHADGDAVVWRFERTPPLPTYLVAVAAGPFDVVEAAPGSCAVPLRVITTRGKGHLARYALQITPRLLAALEAWIGVPYPYGKLDLVGVPNFGAGAMENVGLITFREQLLLLDPDGAPVHDRMWAEIVIAHELAHMWFGNLVTMAWWDELWLNEAFATHLETLAVHAVSPGYAVPLEAIRETDRVMAHDALTRARAIRQPIIDGGDVLNAFDAITYGKGAAVVRMLAAWLGEDTFRAAVRQYLQRHAHGTACTEDLVAALQAASRQPVGDVLRGFLDQPGVPLLALHPVDGDRRRWRYRVTRHRPGPATDTDRPTAQWTLPVTLRYAVTATAGAPTPPPQTMRLLLTAPEGELRVPAPVAWLHPNDGESGYYRWRLPPADLETLLAAAGPHLSQAERVALPGHLWALLEADQLTADRWCTLAARQATHAHWHVLSALIDGLRRITSACVSPAQQAAWAAWIHALLAPHVARLGASPRPDEPHDDRLARPPLLRACADLGGDVALQRALASEGLALLDDFARADPERLHLALPIAAWSADAALLDRLLAAAAQAPTPAHRQAALKALGSVRDPDRVPDALDRFLSPAVRSQDLFTLLRPASQRRATRARLTRWLDRRYPAVVEKVGPEAAAHLPRLWADAASRGEREQVVAFFESTERRPPGGERILGQVLEGIDRNIRLAHRCGPDVARFLLNVTPHRSM